MLLREREIVPDRRTSERNGTDPWNVHKTRRCDYQQRSKPLCVVGCENMVHSCDRHTGAGGLHQFVFCQFLFFFFAPSKQVKTMF